MAAGAQGGANIAAGAAGGVAGGHVVLNPMQLQALLAQRQQHAMAEQQAQQQAQLQAQLRAQQQQHILQQHGQVESGVQNSR